MRAARDLFLKCVRWKRLVIPARRNPQGRNKQQLILTSFWRRQMASSPTVVAPQKPLEDPLAHLPCSSIVEYRKGQMIYNQDQPSTSIYLVIDGKVKVSRLADDGHQVVVDIYQPDEFFGESAFLNLPHRSEQATALENTKLMTWTTSEIEDIVMKRPRLAVALLQILVQRTIDFTHRIESFSVDNIARRLARSLIRFSERLGTPEDDGSIRSEKRI